MESSALLHLYCLYLYKVFTRQFRIGGSCNFPILCAHFLWLKFVQRFWRSWYLNLRYFVIISPLEKGVVFHLITFKSSSPKDALCQVWLKLVLEKKMKMWKVYDNNDNDNGQILIRKAHLSFRLRWAKNNSKRLKRVLHVKGHDKPLELFYYQNYSGTWTLSKQLFLITYKLFINRIFVCNFLSNIINNTSIICNFYTVFHSRTQQVLIWYDSLS